jgi:hypothetical protein
VGCVVTSCHTHGLPNRRRVSFHSEWARTIQRSTCQLDNEDLFLHACCICDLVALCGSCHGMYLHHQSHSLRKMTSLAMITHCLEGVYASDSVGLTHSTNGQLSYASASEITTTFHSQLHLNLVDDKRLLIRVRFCIVLEA